MRINKQGLCAGVMALTIVLGAGCAPSSSSSSLNAQVQVSSEVWYDAEMAIKSLSAADFATFSGTVAAGYNLNSPNPWTEESITQALRTFLRLEDRDRLYLKSNNATWTFGSVASSSAPDALVEVAATETSIVLNDLSNDFTGSSFSLVASTDCFRSQGRPSLNQFYRISAGASITLKPGEAGLMFDNRPLTSAYATSNDPNFSAQCTVNAAVTAS